MTLGQAHMYTHTRTHTCTYTHLVSVPVEVINARRVEGRGPADDAVHLVALLQQQLRQVRPVLPRDARDERALGCPLLLHWCFEARHEYNPIRLIQ
jgi:hypothetical protein